MHEDPAMCSPVRFTSQDGHTQIHAHIWQDASGRRPKAIVQIVHGMAEHIGRYDDFARFLVNRGYAVCGHDQLGHGASSRPEDWGVIPADEGKDILIGDIRTMGELAAEQLGRDLGRFLFGHSMGSYLARACITRFGTGLQGAVLSGTGHVPPVVSRAGHALAKFVCAKDGQRAKSAFLDSLVMGQYSKQVKDAKTESDWLSRNEDNVRRYRADERCGFMFSAGGFAMLTGLTAEVCSAASARRIPKTLPLLYVAGAEDPVGSCGKGVRTASEQARTAGVADVTVKIYPHMRHEILNETGHGAVYEDIAAWLDGHTD